MGIFTGEMNRKYDNPSSKQYFLNLHETLISFLNIRYFISACGSEYHKNPQKEMMGCRMSASRCRGDLGETLPELF